jgi:hypothetical protein
VRVRFIGESIGACHADCIASSIAARLARSRRARRLRAGRLQVVRMGVGGAWIDESVRFSVDTIPGASSPSARVELRMRPRSVLTGTISHRVGGNDF